MGSWMIGISWRIEAKISGDEDLLEGYPRVGFDNPSNVNNPSPHIPGYKTLIGLIYGR